MAAKVSKDIVKDLDELEVDDLEGRGRGKAKRTEAENRQRQRDSIERIKAKAIENGTMRADPTLTVRHVDPATLRPPAEAPAPKPAKPLYDVTTSEEKPVNDTPPRPVDRAAMDAAGLPDEPVPPAPPPAPPAQPPSSESLRGRPREWQPPKREKTCKRCRLPFVPRSGNQRYCDREECRTRECQREGCEIRFTVSAAQPSQKFCSQACSQLALTKASDSNPEEAAELLAAPPGAGELPAEPDAAPDPQPQAESEPDPPSSAGLEAQAPPAGPRRLPRDLSQDLAEERENGSVEALAQEYMAADARYVELLYSLVESEGKQVPEGLRLLALEYLHELWAERAVSGP